MAAKNPAPDAAAPAAAASSSTTPAPAAAAEAASAPSGKPAAANPGPMPNRPGEPAFKLEMSPDCVTFVCTPDKKPVWCDVRLKNTTTDMQSYKVKCTSADIFRVQPPLGYAKPGEQVNIRVWFQNKTTPDTSLKHYFAVYHMKTADKQQPVKEVWTKAAKPDGVRRLPAMFTDKGSA